MADKCSVPGCAANINTFHMLPAEPNCQRAWLLFIYHSLPQTFNPKLLVCSGHFTMESFSNLGQYRAGFAKRLMLRRMAVPTILTPQPAPGPNTKVCIIQGCSRTQELLAFPKDPIVLEKWMLCLDGRLKNPIDASSRVCSVHFTSDNLAFWQRIRPKQENSSIQEDMFGKLRRNVSSQCEIMQRSVGTQLSKSTLTYVRSKASQTPPIPKCLVSAPKASKGKKSKGSNRSLPFMLDGTTVSEVVVQVACLLKLFQKCLECCRDDCSISTGQEGPILHVVQQCWGCGNSREWTSQLPPDPDSPGTGEKPVEMSSEHPAMDIKQEVDWEFENEEEEEEEEEDDEEDDTTDEEEEEEEEEHQKTKKKKGESSGSDEDWVPNMGEFLEGSDEESGSQWVEDYHPHQVVWCSECGGEASASCLRQKHLLLYCCVQCGYRDGYQEPKNSELLDTQRISSPETPSAGHQGGTDDVGQSAESSCSPEEKDENKPTHSSDGPENAGIYSMEEEGSVANTNQGDTRNESHEDASSSNQDGSLQQDAASQENPNIPIYALYFSDPFSLQCHVDEAHCHKRELCPDCGRFMYRRDGRSVHVCDHKVRPFTCLACGKKYTSELKLRLHSQVHSEEHRVSCRYCYKKFKHKEEKQQHEEETHKWESLKFYCPECPTRFTSQKKRKVHLLLTHWKNGRYLCKVCGKRFFQANHLNRHKVIHTGVKLFRCDQCDRSFNQPGHLKSHMRVHTGEKPFKCQECGQCFNHNVSLKNHVQRKHGSTADGEGSDKEGGVDLPTGSDSSDEEEQ